MTDYDDSSSLSDADIDEELEDFDDDLPISEDEDNYKIEDPDDMDDLELPDEEDEVRPKKLTLKLSPQKAKHRLPSRQVQPTDLDEDLILTDEETEYNPHANPDISKMTERQRARYLEDENAFVELGSEKKAKPKKKESAEAIALRKAESARRREDYKNKQLEEEKKDTLNKLLKRRATKTRQVQPGEPEVVQNKADKERRPYLESKGLLRWVSRREGEVLGIQ